MDHGHRVGARFVILGVLVLTACRLPNRTDGPDAVLPGIPGAPSGATSGTPESPAAPAPKDPGGCTTNGDCVQTGCSGQICANDDVVTTCEFKKEYACYHQAFAFCECVAGRCGWRQNAELLQCLEDGGPTFDGGAPDAGTPPDKVDDGGAPDPGPPGGSGGDGGIAALSCTSREAIISPPWEDPQWAPLASTTCNALCDIAGSYDYYSAEIVNGSSQALRLTSYVRIEILDQHVYSVVQQLLSGTRPPFPPQHIALWQIDGCRIIDADALPSFSGPRASVSADGCKISLYGASSVGALVKRSADCPATP